MLGNPSQHLWSDFFTVMKRENIIRPTGPGKNAMGSARLPLDYPTNTQQGSENLMGSCR